MGRLPAPVSKKNFTASVSFGLSVLGMIVMIVWRWLLE